jgi:hypothetical protein
MRPIAVRALLLLSLALSGCATHQLFLKPLRGLPAEDAALLKQGQLKATREQLFDAAATTLEHEPYLHWDIEQLDRANGFIKASAGVLREVQLRVTGGEGGVSQLAVSVPRRELKTRAKVWLKPDGGATAYEPAAGLKSRCRVVSADLELDDLYFHSFAWRALHDRSEVPFDLRAYDAQTEALTPSEAPAPLALQPVAPAPPSPAATSLSATAAAPVPASAAISAAAAVSPAAPLRAIAGAPLAVTAASAAAAQPVSPAAAQEAR